MAGINARTRALTSRVQRYISLMYFIEMVTQISLQDLRSSSMLEATSDGVPTE